MVRNVNDLSFWSMFSSRLLNLNGIGSRLKTLHELQQAKLDNILEKKLR